MRSQSGDAGLADALARLGCEYWPGSIEAYRPWLIELADELREKAARR